MKILILAGGFATRLWPLTERRAKPLLLLDGKTILAHILKKIPRECEIILLTNNNFEQDFKDELKKIKRERVKIFCEDAHSDKEKLGALGAVSMAINHYDIDDNILVVAGDNLLPELRIEQLFCTKNEAITAVRPVKDKHEARKFGVVEVGNEGMKESKNEKNVSVPFTKGDDPDSLIQEGKEGQGVFSVGTEQCSVQGGRQKVLSFEEKPEHPKSTLVSTGFFGIGKDLLPILHDFAARTPDNLGGVFSEFLAQGKDIYAVEVGGEWFDVGSFDTYLEAHKTMQKSKIKNQKSTNTFSGKVFIGEGTEVENCQITDSIIYPRVKLKNCIISHSVIDEGCDFEGLDLNRKLVRRGTTLHSMSN